MEESKTMGEAPKKIEDERPRDNMGLEEMVAEVLKEKDGCSIEELARVLAEKEWLYAVMAGQKTAVSKIALEQKMKNMTRVKRTGTNRWVASY